MLLVSSVLGMHRVQKPSCKGHFIMIINFFYYKLSCMFFPLTYIAYNILIVEMFWECILLGTSQVWRFLSAFMPKCT